MKLSKVISRVCPACDRELSKKESGCKKHPKIELEISLPSTNEEGALLYFVGKGEQIFCVSCAVQNIYRNKPPLECKTLGEEYLACHSCKVILAPRGILGSPTQGE